MQLKINVKRYGFTLAEVLITLGVIGVVAALTIPILVQNANERATVVALKKAYSVLSSAYKLAEQENGTPDTWGIVDVSSPQPISYIAPYFKLDKDCTDASRGCFPRNGVYSYLASSKGIYGTLDNLATSSLRIPGNILVKIGGAYANCSGSYGPNALGNICVTYYVDVNGDKGPNTFGKDTFVFLLTKTGIIPNGVPSQNGWYYFANDCQDKDNTFGIGCTAWVIYNENMDYLHCSDLGWGTKTKCS